jgi:hypothetical protein
MPLYLAPSIGRCGSAALAPEIPAAFGFPHSTFAYVPGLDNSGLDGNAMSVVTGPRGLRRIDVLV